MQFQVLFAFLLATAFAKNILLTNDDSWVSTNIRATYYKLKEAGHNVYLVAPVSQRSGWAGKFDVPSTNVLQTDGEFGYVKAGEPAWGHEVDDDHIWYFNGTPGSCVAFALTYVIPEYFKTNITFDLLVSGPNEGTNLSPGLLAISGTNGGLTHGLFRDIPGMSFSGSNSNNSFYRDFLNLSDPLEPSTIYAEKVVEIATQAFKAQGANPRTLPSGVGIDVNLPKVGYQDETCLNPKWVSTRLTGEYSYAPNLHYNATTNLFSYVQTPMYELTVCQNGVCSLPSETDIIEHTKCASSVSIVSVDYDANAQLSNEAKSLLTPLFE